MWNPDLYNDKHAFVFNYGEGLIDLLAPNKSERILDVGCGAGQLTHKIGELAKEAVGIDSSAEMIKDAQAKYPNLTFQVADAANFSFEEKFDSIFSNAALHWVNDNRAAAKCMYNALKTDGKLVVEFGGKGNVQTIINQIKNSLANRGYTEQASTELWYFPSIGEYTSLLEETGFRVLMAQHYDRPTELADEQTGIMDWISMFGDGFFQGIDETKKQEIIQEVQDTLKPTCFKDGKWHADYKRIRVVAVKEE